MEDLCSVEQDSLGNQTNAQLKSVLDLTEWERLFSVQNELKKVL